MINIFNQLDIGDKAENQKKTKNLKMMYLKLLINIKKVIRICILINIQKLLIK